MAFRGASRLWPGGRGLGGSGRAGLWSQGPRQSSLRVPAPWNQAASPACTAGGTSGHGASAQSSPFSSPSPLPGALTAPSPPARATSYCFVSRGRNPTRGESPITDQIHGRMGPELWRGQVMSERDLVGLLPSSLRLQGQKGSFTHPGQSQHRLRFPQPQLLHRWGAGA